MSSNIFLTFPVVLAYVFTLYLVYKGVHMLPFSLLLEALGQRAEPDDSELSKYQDNLLGARYVTLAYGLGSERVWIRYLRRTTRILLVLWSSLFSLYLICWTVVYGQPEVRTFWWLVFFLLLAYALDILSMGVQWFSEILRGLPLSSAGRRKWAIHQVLAAPKTFLAQHTSVPAPKIWWYGRNWYLTLPYTLLYLSPSPIAIWLYLAGEDAKLTHPGVWYLAIGLGNLLIALPLALDGIARLSSWNGAPADVYGYGLSVLLQDLRRPGAV
jgi:hypothetical protein